MKRLKDWLLAIGCALVGAYMVFTVCQGLLTGQIAKLSKNTQAIIDITQEPMRFWIAIVFWSIGAAMLLGASYYKFTRAGRDGS